MNGLETWNTTGLISMTTAFMDAYKFNGNISGWNVANITNLQNVFSSCHEFNQELNAWNVTNVTNLVGTFVKNERKLYYRKNSCQK